MNSSNEFNVVGTQGIVTKSITTEKKLTLNAIQWQFLNDFQMTLLSQDHTSKLKIQNHLCEMNGNVIKKTTEIIYKQKVYKIQDTYALNFPSTHQNTHFEQLPREQKDGISTNDSEKTQTKEKNNDKKVYIFKNMRKRKLGHDEDENLRNTKNVSKNFCKAFISYLKSQKISDIDKRKIKEAIKIYNELLGVKRYNNNLIKKIISNQVLRDIFKHFLENEARNWISQSRVNDKNLHYQAINIYLGLFNLLHVVKRGEQSSQSSENNQNPSNEQ